MAGRVGVQGRQAWLVGGIGGQSGRGWQGQEMPACDLSCSVYRAVLPVFPSSCLSAPLGAPRLPRQADTHTLADTRDP